MKIIFIYFIMICSATLTHSQTHSVKGHIVAEGPKNPVALAIVYFSNTSIGTTTNENGEFTLDFPGNGKYTLVVTSLGYESYSMSVSPVGLMNKLEIVLQRKLNNLPDVVIRNFDRGGWQKWGYIFRQNLLGTSSYADHCSIKNYIDIKFHYSEKRDELIAFSEVPLQIENKDLGYSIEFDLKEFSLNFTSGVCVFLGYPLFREMKSDNNDVITKWKKNREEAYVGSLTHFMRSLFNNSLYKDGFRVRTLKKVDKEEKKRVLNLLKAKNKSEGMEYAFVPDSLSYYTAVMNASEEAELVLPRFLDEKEFFAKTTEAKGILCFPDYLEVSYSKKGLPIEYIRYEDKRPVTKYPQSTIGFFTERMVEVYKDGNYFKPQNLKLERYWGWSEKLAAMLPYDYISQ